MTAIRRHAPLLILAAALTLTTAAGCSSAPPSITAHATLTLYTGPLSGTTVTTAYPDITDGSQVTVTSPAGTVLTTGTLAYDKPLTDAEAAVAGVEMGLGASADLLQADIAVYTFTVTVPGGQSRYGISVGQNRGTIWETAAQMEAGPGLTLGSLSGS